MATSDALKVTEKQLLCPNCLKTLKVEAYSAGLSDIVPFTCDRDSTVLALSTQDRRIETVLEGYPMKGWSESDYEKVEARLIPCPCGGKFKRDAIPKCTNCGAPLQPKLGRSEFIVVGKMIDGEKENPWLKDSRK